MGSEIICQVHGVIVQEFMSPVPSHDPKIVSLLPDNDKLSTPIKSSHKEPTFSLSSPVMVCPLSPDIVNKSAEIPHPPESEIILESIGLTNDHIHSCWAKDDHKTHKAIIAHDRKNVFKAIAGL